MVTSEEQNYFSVIADEVTDVSNKEQMTICIRLVDDDFSVHEDLVEFICFPKTDSNTLTCTLKYFLIRHCLSTSQCHGQAYDGASNMSGHLRGVAAQIQ